MEKTWIWCVCVLMCVFLCSTHHTVTLLHILRSFLFFKEFTRCWWSLVFFRGMLTKHTLLHHSLISACVLWCDSDLGASDRSAASGRTETKSAESRAAHRLTGRRSDHGLIGGAGEKGCKTACNGGGRNKQVKTTKLTPWKRQNNWK